MTQAQAFRSSRNGAVLIYVTVLMLILFLFGAFSVDFGRMQVAKSSLITASDAAAHAGGMVMLEGGSISQVLAAASGTAGKNIVDGNNVDVRPGDITIGVYDLKDKKFYPTNDPAMANAVRVTLAYQFGKQGPDLSFWGIFSNAPKTLQHEAMVMVSGEPEGWAQYSTTIKTPPSSGGTPPITSSNTTKQSNSSTAATKPKADPKPKVEVIRNGTSNKTQSKPQTKPQPKPQPKPKAKPQPKPTQTKTATQSTKTTTTTTPGTSWNKPGTTTTTVTTQATKPASRTLVKIK